MGTWIVGGFWIASAIEVFAWTWQSFQITYSKFPDTAGEANVDLGLAAQGIGEGVISKVPVIGKPIAGALQGIGSFLGISKNLNAKQIERLAALPSPPSRIVSQLQRSIKEGAATNGSAASARRFAAAGQAFVNWATANGYTRSDIKNWFIAHPDVLGPLTPAGVGGAAQGPL